MAPELEGGAPASADGAPAGTPAATPASGTPATPAAGAAPTATPTGFTYAEDRSQWIPKHRFDQVNTQAGRAKQLEADIAERDRKIAALAGVTQSDPDTAQAEKVKEAFFNLPGMGGLRKFTSLSEDELTALLNVPSQVQRTTQAEQRQWQRHGDEQVQYIGGKIAEALGAEAPDADQLDDLRGSFTKWLRNKAAKEMQTVGHSEALTRYEAGDKKLLDEFVTGYSKRWVEPAKRTAVSSAINRTRPVPNSAGRAATSTTQKPAAFKNLDERLDYAAKLFKERGGQFSDA